MGKRNTYKDKPWTPEMVRTSRLLDLVGRKITFMLDGKPYRGYVTGAITKEGLVYVMIDSKYLPNGNGPVPAADVSERVQENRLQPISKAARIRYHSKRTKW